MPALTPDQLVKHIHDRTLKATRRGLVSAAMRLVGVIQNELIPAENPPPINMRAYTAAWIARASEMGMDVVNTIPYAAIIEFGARAENIKVGREMIDALAKWAQQKGIATDDADARQAAWAIATSMTRKGIFNRGGSQGLRIAEKAGARAPAIASEEIRREIVREFK